MQIVFYNEGLLVLSLQNTPNLLEHFIQVLRLNLAQLMQDRHGKVNAAVEVLLINQGAKEIIKVPKAFVRVGIVLHNIFDEVQELQVLLPKHDG